MIKVESLNVTYTACNNGTSALITKDGELYMFGKDTAHCHHATGNLCQHICMYTELVRYRQYRQSEQSSYGGIFYFV